MIMFYSLLFLDHFLVRLLSVAVVGIIEIDPLPHLFGDVLLLLLQLVKGLIPLADFSGMLHVLVRVVVVDSLMIWIELLDHHLGAFLNQKMGIINIYLCFVYARCPELVHDEGIDLPFSEDSRDLAHLGSRQ